ncbi:MAG TPA: PfkB family carbohydrate kinase [Candidatus Hydrogenedentes bacterium]|nr:PfkB family carbohydrate kinase [Candidatus Hydrogenedentota bacterium]HOS02756.1 PfkB family carbohydrate kinase [Candidatus Hydrogenedentota bacterium]
MSVTVVGSVALDTVETPAGRNDEGLGGAATFFSLAASFYTDVHLVGVVGEDFPEQHVALLQSKNISLNGLERAPGKTFRWTGRYHDDINERDTLDTQLNVFEHFHPKLPRAACESEFLFLGNIHPALQMEVLEQANAGFVGLDTMNLWINVAGDGLKAVLKEVDALIINDSEVRLLTGERNIVVGASKVHALGPEIVVVKKGEHGCLLFQGDRLFAVPAFPLRHVVDPTGAGDTFAGGFMGSLAKQGHVDWTTLRQAVVHGSVAASFTCEAFGPDRLAAVTYADIMRRYDAFRALTQFT